MKFFILSLLIASTKVTAQDTVPKKASNEHYISVNTDGVQGGNYNNDGATGENSIALGKDAKAKKEGNIAIGNGAITNVYENDQTQGKDSIAIGTGAKTNRGNSVAVGKGAATSWDSGVAIGDEAKSLGNHSIAIGKNSQSKNPDSIAIGTNTRAESKNSIAIGKDITSSMDSFVAGTGSSAVGANTSVVIGYKNKAILGEGGLTDTSYQISIGAENIAEGGKSTVIGKSSHAYNSSVAIGENNIAGAPAKTKPNEPLTLYATDHAVAIGTKNKATASYTTSVGNRNISQGFAGTTLGTDNKALGHYSTAIGYKTTAEGKKATAIGTTASSSGESSLAFGNGSVSSANNSIAVGTNAKALTNNGIAIGTSTTTDGHGAVSIGENANSNSGISIGKNSNGARYSIAIGEGASSNNGSIVVGKGAKSEGTYGENNVVIGIDATVANDAANSTVLGKGAKVETSNSVAIGADSVARERNQRWGYDTAANGSVDISSKLTDEQNQQYENAKNEYKTAVSKGKELGKQADELTKIPYDQRTPEQKAKLLQLNNDIGANNKIVSEKYEKISEFDSTWRATAGEVAIGDAKNNITRQITGVAAGSQDTDAVNVAQLKSLDKKVFDRLEGENVYFGKDAEATGKNSVAIGNKASALAENSIAIGAGSKTKVSYENTIAKYTEIQNMDSTYGVVSVGGGGITRRITNVAGGVESTDAVNVGQLDKVNETLSGKIEDNADKIEDNADKIQDNADKIKDNADKIKDNADKIQDNADKIKDNADKIKDNADKIKDNADKIKDNADKIQDNADKIKDNSDKINSIESNQSGTNDKIKENTDKIKNNTDKIEKNNDKIKDNADKIKDNSSAISNLQENNQNIMAQVEANSERISQLSHRLNKGLAASAAMAGIEFLDINENEITYGVAVGAYRGEQAVAIGLQGAPTQNTRIHGKASVTTGKDPDAMVSIGASWKFNFR